MSTALKKADGDIFIDPDTGRGEVVSGASKISQELFSLLATDYDAARDWGSQLDLSDFGYISSQQEFQSLLTFRVMQALDRMTDKQQRNAAIVDLTELITGFPTVSVIMDPSIQAGIFYIAAAVGVYTSQAVALQVIKDYKPLSIRQVQPPPVPTAATFLKNGT